MITLDDNEGNVLTITAHFAENTHEDFISAFYEKFEKWGRFTVSGDSMDVKIVIDDANPAKAVRGNWIEDFTDFSRDTGAAFTVYWVPYVGAFLVGFSCLIENGVIVAEGSPSWGPLIDV